MYFAPSERHTPLRNEENENVLIVLERWWSLVVLKSLLLIILIARETFYSFLSIHANSNLLVFSDTVNCARAPFHYNAQLSGIVEIATNCLFSLRIK